MKKLLLTLAFLFAFPVSAATFPEGAIVKTPDNPDVYIIKYNAGKQYKRLILNPQVFQSYGHLKWENLLIASDSELDAFVTSDLVRVDGTTDVYQLVPEGDTGGKYRIVETDGCDLDSVYIINNVDFGNYDMRGTRKVAEEVGGSGNYTGSFDKGNYVYGAAMNLAWNEMAENIVHEAPAFVTSDPAALNIISKLNAAPFTKQDLDEASYYVKSGFGQETITAINQESRQKFPTKSFPDLSFTLAPTDFISYAYFLKQVEYPVAFTKNDVTFDGEQVKGFSADSAEQSGNVQILDYTDQDHFIVKLKLKDMSDEIFLAKGLDMTDPTYAVSLIGSGDKSYLPSLSDDDVFRMPEIHLDYARTYDEMIGLPFRNQTLPGYEIAAMFENIKFDMDNKGARVENEAGIIGTTSMPVEPVERKYIILDKPFWVVMKRTDSRNPYFILGVNNTAIMDKTAS